MFSHRKQCLACFFDIIFKITTKKNLSLTFASYHQENELNPMFRKNVIRLTHPRSFQSQQGEIFFLVGLFLT